MTAPDIAAIKARLDAVVAYTNALTSNLRISPPYPPSQADREAAALLLAAVADYPALLSYIEQLQAEIERLQKVVDAAISWQLDRGPKDPGDADLLKALWTFGGDITEPCEGCEGDCGEPCEPTTVEAAHRALDKFSEHWRKEQGIVQLPDPPPDAGNGE